MLMAAMRLNIPTSFCVGRTDGSRQSWMANNLTLVDAMVQAADDSVSDEQITKLKTQLVPPVVRVRACSLPIR